LSRDPERTGPTDPQRLTRAQVGFYAVGYVVLAAGSGGSFWAYRAAVADELGDALKAQARDTKGYQGQMEYLGGKANVLGSDISNWFTGLWHGRNLAYTLAVLTLVIALMCFYIAFALPDLPPFDAEPAEGGNGPKKQGPRGS
jgi:hypothetical protein